MELTAPTDIWILDDGPFGTLAQNLPGLPSDPDFHGWPEAQFFVPEAAADYASGDQSGRRPRLLEAHGGPFCVARIVLGTTASEILYEHLRARYEDASNDLGEHEAIAWVLADEPNGIFVTQDKQAMAIAHAELGRGRVAHPFDFWDELRLRGLVDIDTFGRLCRSTYLDDQHGLPGIPWRFQSLLGTSP